MLFMRVSASASVPFWHMIKSSWLVEPFDIFALSPEVV